MTRPDAIAVSSTARYVRILLLALVPASMVDAQPHIPEIHALMRIEIEKERVAGAVVQVVRDGTTLHRSAYGFAQRYGYGMRPLSPPDTASTRHLFDLASLTKVLGTTFAVMMLADEGALSLDTPVRTYLPEFSGRGKDSVTVRHLLTHTGGLAPWEPTYYHASSRDEALAHVARMPLAYAVGTNRYYSDLGFMLLGYVVERVAGQSLDAYLREKLFEPMGLHRIAFTPLARGFTSDDVAATSHGNPFERRMVYDDTLGYECDEDPDSWNGWRRYTLRGEVNDGNAYYTHDGVAGHAGLFAAVDDVQTLLDLVLRRGTYGGIRLIDEETVDAFLTPDFTGNGLGWAMDPTLIRAEGAPAGTFGHTGFTGTSVVVIPAYDTTIIFLTNRQNVGPDESGMYYDLSSTRQRLVDIVLDRIRR